VASRRLGTASPVIAVLLLAPVSAEYSSGYLENTGKPFELLFGLLFFAPLYGGAALLVREISLRLGGGWPTRLLLASAYGLAQTGLIDLSLFTRHRADVAEWETIVGPTWVDGLGLSVGAGTSWTLGHVLLSTAGPLAIVEALAPGSRDRVWLRPRGLAVTGVAFLAVCWFVRHDQHRAYGASPAAWQLGLVVLAVLGLVAAGIVVARRSRPARRQRDGRPPPAVLLLGIGFVAMLAADLAFLNWATLVATSAIVAGIGWYLVRAGRRTGWSARQAGLLAAGALASRAALAFTNPPPEGVPLAGKLIQNVVFALIVLALVSLIALRRTPDPLAGAGHVGGAR
jgi:hypothetical protein